MPRDQKSATYLFVLGRTPELSIAELQAIYPSFHLKTLGPRVIKVGNTGEILPKEIMSVLGGTTKIGVVVSTISKFSPSEIAKIILLNVNKQFIVFGLSTFVDFVKITRHFLNEVKNILEKSGKQVRYIEPKDGTELSSVVIQKQKIYEFIIAVNKNRFVIAQTEVVQDFEDWNKRDYGRPYADPRLGMLPPKVARMLVNLASYHASFWQASTRARPESPWDAGQSSMKKRRMVLLDPFCGMGTILSEALLSGWNVVGGDQSPEQIAKARKNIMWLNAIYSQTLQKTCDLFTGEATHVDKYLKDNSIDAIVTEPFMGAQDKEINIKKAKNIVRGLEKLYIGCLKNWYKRLKKSGKVVIALPQYVIYDNVLTVKKVIDNCENLGYTRLVGPIEYFRPQAIVRRNFYIFQKK